MADGYFFNQPILEENFAQVQAQSQIIRDYWEEMATANEIESKLLSKKLDKMRDRLE
jgi:hypothetical protein